MKNFDSQVQFFNSPSVSLHPKLIRLLCGHDIHPAQSWARGWRDTESQCPKVSPMSVDTVFLEVKVYVDMSVKWPYVFSLCPFVSFPSRTFWNRKTLSFPIRHSTKPTSFHLAEQGLFPLSGGRAFASRPLTLWLVFFLHLFFLDINREPLWGWNLKTVVLK